MTKEELLEQKALLQQQLAIMNDRSTKSSIILAKKRMVRKNECEARADAKRVEIQEKRKSKSAAARRAAHPPPIAGASAFPLTGDAERIRMDCVMRRTIRNLKANKYLHTESERPKAMTGGFRKQKIRSTIFATCYDRGELPCVIEHGGSRNGLTWVCPLLQLDYMHYLPIFFDGIRCTEEPYSFIARQGVYELLQEAKGHPGCIMPCIHELVKSLRLALQTRDHEVVVTALKVLRQLVKSNDGVGEALVPYYRQLLPVLNILSTKRRNTGDVWTDNSDIGTAALETLEVLEQHGGDNAFATMKRMVPTYESFLSRAIHLSQ